MRDQRARIRRLSLWFSLNLIIFIACYLNYRLQLKHRYLFKILNVSNFNTIFGQTSPRDWRVMLVTCFSELAGPPVSTSRVMEMSQVLSLAELQIQLLEHQDLSS